MLGAMVATTTSSTVTSTPSVDPNNIARRLFTDFSPLLALFGDEVTKQFLSMSLGFGDDLLLAIAPVGIITIIVSAIRVGGYRWMKSIIGRARDSPDDEEKEILSSTSSSVREIWNGHRVIRQAGESQVVQLVFQEGRSNPDDIDPLLLEPLQGSLENGHWVVQSFKEQHQPSFLRLLLYPFRRDRPVKRFRLEEENNGLDEITMMTLLMRKKAPNLTINIPDAVTDPMYLWLCVILGAILQCLVFFFNAYVVYHLHWLRGAARVASYGFPLWASGTALINLGSFMCAYVIGTVTTQYVVKPKTNNKLRVVGFQKAIPLMNLPAYAFLHKDPQVLVSQRTTFVGKRSMSDLDETSRDITTDLFLQKKNRMAFNTLLGTWFTLSGFVLQNLGSRELHVSAPIAQLIVTLALTMLRSWVRRNVGSPPPDCKELKRGVETTHMIYELCGIRTFTDYAKCSILQSEDSSRSRLRIDSSTTPLYDRSPYPYKRYARRLLLSQIYLEELDLAPGQDRFLFDKATKAIASLNRLGFTKRVEKLILFCAKTHNSSDSDNINDSENSEGSIDLALSLNREDIPGLHLAALWSFCFYDYYQSRGEIGDFQGKIWAFHIVAVVKSVDYRTKLELLGKYIGDHNINAWRMDSDNHFILLKENTFKDSPRKDACPLFGLHYLKKNSSDGSTRLKSDDVIITYANSHPFHEHLAADLVSSYLLGGLLSGGGDDRQVNASSTQYCARLSRTRLKNDYFDGLAEGLKECISDDDLGLAAIIPAFMHHGLMPRGPRC